MVPEFTVANYSQVIKHALDESECYRMLIHDLPRRFHEADREQQARALEPAPPLTGTRWDALLAGMAEHLAMLHEHPIQGWMNERERFLDLTWILSEGNPVLVSRSLIDSPAAFLRHGALPDREISTIAAENDPMRALSHDEIVDAFKDLSDRLGRKRVKAHIYIVGGAAIALAFRRSRRTFDVDALILEGHGAVLEASREVARQRGWPDSWLNEQATTYLPLNPDQRAKTVFASSHLVVTGASPEHLLAMKLRSGRQADLTDIATLVDVLQLSTAEEVFGVHDAVFPSQPIGEEQRRAIEFFLQSHRKT